MTADRPCALASLPIRTGSPTFPHNCRQKEFAFTTLSRLVCPGMFVEMFPEPPAKPSTVAAVWNQRRLLHTMRVTRAKIECVCGILCHAVRERLYGRTHTNELLFGSLYSPTLSALLANHSFAFKLPDTCLRSYPYFCPLLPASAVCIYLLNHMFLFGRLYLSLWFPPTSSRFEQLRCLVPQVASDFSTFSQYTPRMQQVPRLVSLFRWPLLHRCNPFTPVAVQLLLPSATTRLAVCRGNCRA